MLCPINCFIPFFYSSSHEPCMQYMRVNKTIKYVCVCVYVFCVCVCLCVCIQGTKKYLFIYLCPLSHKLNFLACPVTHNYEITIFTQN